MSLLSCLACSFATQFYCFLCKWDSRNRKYNYIQKQWPKRESLIPRQKNAVNTPLINPEKVYLPPVHITLRLAKKFDQKSAGFMYLKNKFPRISDDKIKEDEFVVPQIRELIQNVKSADQLGDVEKAAWKLFKNVNANFFLGGKS
jgi:hypothetical protein